MNNTLKKYCTKAVLASLLIAPLFILGTASAQTEPTPQENINKALACGANLQFSIPEEGCETGDANDAAEQVDQIVKQIINILSLVVGVVAVIMIIFGGLRYITSGGDTGNVTSAKNTILYAVVGLIVVALAQVVVRFVVDRATQTTGSSGPTD
jgi:uncharacterized membrane protein